MAKVVSLELFLTELKSESEAMQLGTTYRQRTAEMAFEAAEYLKNVELFTTRETAYKALQSYFNTSDEERLLDVSKYLNVVYKQLEALLSMPEKVRLQLEQRKKMRGKVSLVQC